MTHAGAAASAGDNFPIGRDEALQQTNVFVINVINRMRAKEARAVLDNGLWFLAHIYPSSPVLERNVFNINLFFGWGSGSGLVGSGLAFGGWAITLFI
jgi:hypothetical protein